MNGFGGENQISLNLAVEEVDTGHERHGMKWEVEKYRT